MSKSTVTKRRYILLYVSKSYLNFRLQELQGATSVVSSSQLAALWIERIARPSDAAILAGISRSKAHRTWSGPRKHSSWAAR